MRLVCRDFGVPDMPRRGISPHEAPLEILLLDVEAELSIWGDGQAVWSEEMFPVAELAYQLALWLRRPDAEHEDFVLDSMHADPGLIRIVGSDDGWRVGSVFTPDSWTLPITWDALVTAIREFVGSVRQGVAEMGIDPDFIPAP